MGFLERVTEKENALLIQVRKEAGRLPLYIWGAGQGGHQVSMLLEAEGIPFAGKLVNRGYYHEEEGVQCMEELMETVDKINLIIAVGSYDKTILEKYSRKIENVLIYDVLSALDIAGNFNVITYPWICRNEKKLQEIYNMLSDELSRECFTAFLNQKVSMKYGFLSQVKTPYQYFDEELVHFKDSEVFLDCGAYDGDTAEAFVRALDRQGIDTWQEIISFEPDPDNYARLMARGLERHRCIPKGVADQEGVMCFSAGDTSGGFDESGDMKIEVDTIDHVVGDGEATIIKMDIEGSELSALKGAQNTIRRCHPLLAVCLYHKKEDLYEIPLYIRKLMPEYKFYLRAYDDRAIELVLYAVYQPVA